VQRTADMCDYYTLGTAFDAPPSSSPLSLTLPLPLSPSPPRGEGDKGGAVPSLLHFPRRRRKLHSLHNHTVQLQAPFQHFHFDLWPLGALAMMHQSPGALH